MSVNEKIATEIKDFILKRKIGGDLRIYFDDNAFEIDHNENVSLLKGISAIDYVEYANPETVTMSYEGKFYEHMNGYGQNQSYDTKIREEFEKIVNKFGFYSELGYAWSLSLYPMK